MGPVRQACGASEVEVAGGVQHDPVTDHDRVDVGVTGEFGEDPPRAPRPGSRTPRTGRSLVGASASTTTRYSGRPGLLAVPPVRIRSASANARRWSCLAPGSVGHVSGVDVANSASSVSRRRASSRTPVSGSNRALRFHMPSRSTQRAQTRRSSLTLQGVHAVGGLQAAGFVTHPPSELGLAAHARRHRPAHRHDPTVLRAAMGRGSCRRG